MNQSSSPVWSTPALVPLTSAGEAAGNKLMLNLVEINITATAGGVTISVGPS